MYVYDAITLEALACVRPRGERKPIPEHAGYIDMVWGVHGFHLAHHSTNLSEMGHFQLLKHAPGASKYRQFLWCSQQPLQQPAMSPCGAFVCLYVPGRGCTKVADLRSRRTVLRHPLGLPMQAQLDFELCSAINIW